MAELDFVCGEYEAVLSDTAQCSDKVVLNDKKKDARDTNHSDVVFELRKLLSEIIDKSKLITKQLNDVVTAKKKLLKEVDTLVGTEQSLRKQLLETAKAEKNLNKSIAESLNVTSTKSSKSSKRVKCRKVGNIATKIPHTDGEQIKVQYDRPISVLDHSASIAQASSADAEYAGDFMMSTDSSMISGIEQHCDGQDGVSAYSNTNMSVQITSAVLYLPSSQLMVYVQPVEHTPIVQSQQNCLALQPIQPRILKKDLTISNERATTSQVQPVPTFLNETSFNQDVSSETTTTTTFPLKEMTKQLTRKKKNTMSTTRLKCDKCYKRFIRVSNYQRHLQLHHISSTGTMDRGQYRCSRCDKTFARRYALTRHERLHSGDLRHLCSVCGKGFVDATYLRQHVEGHTRQYSCTVCGRSFSRPKDLRVHHRQHTGESPYACSMCESSFKSYNGLQYHKLTAHSGSKKHACVVCGRRFPHVGNLRSHMRTHSDEKRTWSCSMCEEKFPNTYRLKVHLLDHPGAGEAPFICTQCPKRFVVLGNLKSHLRSHVTDTPYRCGQCKKQYKKAQDLHRHQTKIHRTGGAASNAAEVAVAEAEFVSMSMLDGFSTSQDLSLLL